MTIIKTKFNSSSLLNWTVTKINKTLDYLIIPVQVLNYSLIIQLYNKF